MSLVLYGHPFSSYTQKVLIALYENDTRFEFRSLGPDTPQHAAEWLRRWPLRKSRCSSTASATSSRRASSSNTCS